MFFDLGLHGDQVVDFPLLVLFTPRIGPTTLIDLTAMEGDKERNSESIAIIGMGMFGHVYFIRCGAY